MKSRSRRHLSLDSPEREGEREGENNGVTGNSVTNDLIRQREVAIFGVSFSDLSIHYSQRGERGGGRRNLMRENELTVSGEESVHCVLC